MAARLSLRFAALGYLAALLAFPVGLVFWRTFENGLGPVWNAATNPEALHALWLTVLIALIAVPANTIFGVICALVIVRGRFHGKTSRMAPAVGRDRCRPVAHGRRSRISGGKNASRNAR